MTLTCCQDHILTENIWFVWSKTSYSGDERRCYRCGTTNERTNSEYRATQPMEAGGWVSQLNLAVKFTLSLGCITNCWLKSVPEVKIQLFSHVFLDENLLSLSCSWPNVLMREKNWNSSQAEANKGDCSVFNMNSQKPVVTASRQRDKVQSAKYKLTNIEIED